MAAHAVERGIIASEALAEVLAERVAQQGGAGLHPTHAVRRPTPEGTREAVEQGAVRDALTDEPGADAPPNVVVEPADGQRPNAGDQGRA
jgi:hypothetical protein